MRDLETQLRALAADAAWPATPDLARAVADRLAAGHSTGGDAIGGAGRPPEAGHAAAGQGRRRPAAGWFRGGRGRRVLAAVLAALVLLPAAGAVAFPGARDDVLEWLGLRNVSVRRVPAPPPSARVELEADLGRLVTLAEAEREAGFAAALPAALGPPDRVRIDDERISLIYAPRAGLPRLEGVDAGLILTESRGGIEGPYLEKLLLGGTGAQRVDVRGRRGVYISGGAHAYVYVTPEGELRDDRALLAGPTVIWEGAGLVHRLETAAPRAGALQIARSTGD